MSLMPYGMSWGDWPVMNAPSRMFGQEFGMPDELERMMCPYGYGGFGGFPRNTMSMLPTNTGMSEVTNTKDKFMVGMDVRHFKPSEISVKVVDNCVTIEGKHEEKPDEHGYIQRHFVRKYKLPEGTKEAELKSRLSADGRLIIEAPKVPAIEGKKNERPIPIEMAKK